MPETLREKRQRLSDIKAEGRTKQDALDTLEAKDNPSEDEQQQIAALNAEIDKLVSDIEDLQAEVDAEQTRRDRAAALSPLPAAADDSDRRVVILSNEPNPAETFGFDSFGHFARAVHAANPNTGGAVDERLTRYAAPTNFHEEGGASGEGYMVPPAHRQQIWELTFGDDPLLDEVDWEDTNSNAVDFTRDETTPWGSTGVQAKWRSEGSQMTGTKMVTEAELLKLHELYAFVLATEELLEDAPRLTARLTRKAPQAIRYKIVESYFNGSGAGQPLGWMKSGALVTVAKEAGQAADTITAANVTKIYSRQLNPGRAVWLANIDTFPQIATMTIGDQPIWTPPASGLRDAPGGLLLGRPLRWSEHADTLGDLGDIQFVDPLGYYAPRKSGGIKFAESMHLFFDYNMRAFRFIFRLAGQPYLSAPVSPAKGSNTKSHFVTLAARA